MNQFPVDNMTLPSSSNNSCCGQSHSRELSPQQSSKRTEMRKCQSWNDLNKLYSDSHDLKHNLKVAGNASGSQSPSELSLHSTNTAIQVSKELVECPVQCEMCANYEIKLQQLQDNERRLRQQLAASQSLSDRCKNELVAERAQREENETRFSLTNGSLKSEIEKLTERLRQVEQKVAENECLNVEKIKEHRKEVEESVKIRQMMQERVSVLQSQYDQLLGKHRARSEEMNCATIDLPQNLEDLNLFTLQLREELIEAKLAKEHLEENLTSDLVFMRDQLASEQQSKQRVEQSLTEEVNSLRTDLAIAKSELMGMDALHKALDDSKRQIDEHRMTITDLESALAALKSVKISLEKANRENRQRSLILQQELDNCEQVQRDFVRLSQSLQIELEKIRQADHEVRWQHEDDALLCAGCKVAFTKHRRKSHCHHCGKIFCDVCLSKTVASGPQKRLVPVCDVCHTLLVRDTPPYFSSQVPSTVATAENS